MIEFKPALLPAERPRCNAHGVFMELQKPGSAEQRWCGTWYACPGVPPLRCGNVTLLHSTGLEAQLGQQRKAAA